MDQRMIYPAPFDPCPQHDRPFATLSTPLTEAEEAFERISRGTSVFRDRAAVRAALARLAVFEQAHADLNKNLEG